MAHGEVRFVDDAEIRGSPAKVDEELRLVTAEEATSRPPDEMRERREGTIGHPSDRHVATQEIPYLRPLRRLTFVAASDDPSEIRLGTKLARHPTTAGPRFLRRQ